MIDKLHLAGTGNICISVDCRIAGVRSDGNILRSFDGHIATRRSIFLVGNGYIAGTGNIGIAENRRGVAVYSDGNILCAFDGQRSVHRNVLVGDGHIAGASDICTTGDGRGGAVRSDGDILCIGYGQADSGDKPAPVQHDVRTAISADHGGHRI